MHIGVGFEVAYLNRDGKFEGQECEIGNRDESHAFSVCGCQDVTRMFNTIYRFYYVTEQDSHSGFGTC